MTFCDTTTLIPHLVQDYMMPYIENLHATKGIKIGCYFRSNYTDSAWNTAYGKSLIASGVIWPDLYFFPDPISDYTEEAVMRAWDYLLPWFVENFGRIPNAVDFSSGVMSYKSYLAPYFLAADSSVQDLSKTDYGIGVGNPDDVPYSQARYYPRYLNTRALDNGRVDDENYAYYINQVADLIDETMALPNGGLAINFQHLHDLIDMDYNPDGTPKPGRDDYALINGFQAYYDMLASKNANGDIYFAGFGEAVAYLVYRQLVTRCVMYSPRTDPNSKLIIRLQAENTLNIDPNLIQIPISVKFSTNGTPLQGHAISAPGLNLINLGGGDYIVEIPYEEFPAAVIVKS